MVTEPAIEDVPGVIKKKNGANNQQHSGKAIICWLGLALIKPIKGFSGQRNTLL